MASKFPGYIVYLREKSGYKATVIAKCQQVWWDDPYWILRTADGKRESRDLDDLIRNPP